MKFIQRPLAVALVLALLGLITFATPVSANLAEEVQEVNKETKSLAETLPTFDPSSAFSRSRLVRAVDQSMCTAFHWIDPLAREQHVADVAVPPPESVC